MARHPADSFVGEATDVCCLGGSGLGIGCGCSSTGHSSVLFSLLADVALLSWESDVGVSPPLVGPTLPLACGSELGIGSQCCYAGTTHASNSMPTFRQWGWGLRALGYLLQH